ncbi:unnamed protein product [Staurois parvus]|uniref:Uncharacterized protein n=1 Tax=Staurois parvus TaxID=386267 RepID=A0ABN9EWS9_9NEOB|nr:unnamed protein product [Staurois parvus]
MQFSELFFCIKNACAVFSMYSNGTSSHQCSQFQSVSGAEKKKKKKITCCIFSAQNHTGT